jgi:hypothetical protein
MSNNKQNQHKKPQDYILLILNCEKYRHKATRQRETWIPTLSNKIQYYHVLGNPNLNQEYIIDDENHILYLRVPDDYNSLPKKVIAAYKVIPQLYNFKYIFKTDDDQNVVSVKFFEVLMHLLNKSFGKENQIHYGGKIVDVKYTHVSQYYKIHPELPQNLIVKKCKYCNGRFYFLSSASVDSLIERETQINEEYFEDYAIGINLPDNFKSNILRLDTDKVFVDFS